MESEASFERLFAHQAWVRALAARLCEDPAAAEDLAQDAWVAALGSGSRARDPRAWLGGVLRYLARRRVRGDAARSRREAGAALPEGVPSAAELAERAELQRRVLAAVAALDERYRTVVLLRWYEQLGAEEIARRLGVPGSTVRNRLRRAHEALRTALDGEYGGRASWAALFAPTALWTSGAKAAAGMGVVMKVQLAVGVAVLATAAIWLWPGTGGSSGEVAGALAGPSALAGPVRVERAEEAQGAAAEREELALAAERATAAEPVEHVLVWGELAGAGESELAGSLVFLDEQGRSHGATLGARATYSVFGLAPGRYRVAAWLRGFLPLEEELVLEPFEEKVRHDLALERALVLPVRIVDRESGELLTSSWRDHALTGIGVVVTRETPLSIEGLDSLGVEWRGVGEYQAVTDLHRPPGVPSDASGVLQLRERPPVVASLVLRSVVLESRVLTGAEEELVFEVEHARLEEQLGSFSLRCVEAESGRPVEGAKIEVSYADYGGGGDAEADADGRVELAGLTPGRRRLVIQTKERALVQRWIEIEPGERLDLGDVALLPRARITGRVVDSSGESVPARLYTLVPERFADEGILKVLWPREADGMGTFVFDKVGAEPQRLVARADGYAIAVLDVDATSGSVEDLEIHVQRGTEVVVRPARGTLENIGLVLADPAGVPILFEWLYPLAARRWTLAPGLYELRTMLGSEVVRTRRFDVGDRPLTLEVASPR